MKKMLIVGAMALVAAACLSCQFGKSYALTNEYYTVKAGDTLWGIAESYYPQEQKITNFNEFVHNVRRENGFTSGRKMLQPGDVIVIPLHCEVK